MNNVIRSFRKGLALTLLAVSGVVRPGLGNAYPVFLPRSIAQVGSHNQPDVNDMAGQADKLRSEGKYEEALAIWQQILALVEKGLGPDHLSAFISLSKMGLLLKDKGQYAAAEPLFRRALAISEKTLGPEHPYVAASLNSLALLLRKQGQNTAAETLFRRALAINEKNLEPDDPSLANSLSNLAVLLADQGKYAAAEPLFRRALAITEKAFGSDHADVASHLNGLAVLLAAQGHHAAAEPLFHRALIISEKTLGQEHPSFAVILNNVAAALKGLGIYAVAEPLYRRALAIREKVLGPNHPEVASSLNDLAVLLHDQGRHEEVESLYRRALAIREKVLGPNHREVASSLNNLAGFLSNQGQFDAAKPLYLRSLAINELAVGGDHPTVAKILVNLAILLNSEEQASSAVAVLKRALNIQSVWLLRELPLLPNQSRSAQLSELGRAWEVPFGWIKSIPAVAQLALQTRLERHGLLAEIEQRQALLLNAPSPKRAKVEQLQALTQLLASVSLPSERRTAVGEQRDKLQRELYRQNPELGIISLTPAAVAKALPPDGVLVEFQRYQPFEGLKSIGQRWGEAQYIALVLKPDGRISSVALGPAGVIDATVHKGLRASAEQLSDAEATWAQLSIQVLKPLLPQLSGSRQWFLSPDGELNRVPFAALPAPQQPTTPLAQAVQLRLLTTGRELVRLQQQAPAGSPALVMANPSFDRPGAKPAPAPRSDVADNVGQRRSVELGSTQWTPLPDSEREGQQVASLLGTRLISGQAATTTALQRQQGPRVLHVATHGFFVADQESKPTDAMRAIQEDSLLLRSLRQEDPQLRSGLVLAGANQPGLDANDDGYLTAAEALNLNLKGTELVVLSACSTGQGEVSTGEGVYGLQRSLTVAGARSTLLSLWKVNDLATAEFMTRFYTRLKAGEARSVALAATQREFRDGTAGGGQWKDPYYWAAWQLVGDWRPIPGL